MGLLTKIFKGNKEMIKGDLKKECSSLILPYKALEEYGDEIFHGFVFALSTEFSRREVDELLWKKTVSEAQRVIKKVKSLGYHVSDPISLRRSEDEHDIFGDEVRISYEPRAGDKYYMGGISLWRSGGFNSDPVHVKFQDSYGEVKKDVHIEYAIKLSNQLTDAGISHSLYPPLKDLKRCIAKTTERLDRDKYLLNELETKCKEK